TGPFVLTESKVVHYFGQDEAGNATAILNASYVIEKVPPTGAVYPLDGVTNAAVDTNITIRFDMDVTADALGGVNLTAGGIQVPLTDVDLTDSRLTIRHNGLAYNTLYTVTIPANTVRNEHGVGNDVISWSFTTRGRPA